jgi:hypothetical protein
VTKESSLSLPASALVEIRRALGKETDDASACRALHGAGYAAGEAIFSEFAAAVDTSPGDLSAPEFWNALDDYLAEKGWGRISHERIHPGLGVLRAETWSESDADGHEHEPGCWFTSGVFERIFSEVAPGSVAVDPNCSFVLGSSAAIERLRQLLLERESLDDALAHL